LTWKWWTIQRKKWFEKPLKNYWKYTSIIDKVDEPIKSSCVWFVVGPFSCVTGVCFIYLFKSSLKW
jgi:hypothetical protein